MDKFPAGHHALLVSVLKKSVQDIEYVVSGQNIVDDQMDTRRVPPIYH